MSVIGKATQCETCFGVYHKERKECPFCAEQRVKMVKKIKKNIDKLDNTIFNNRNTLVIAEYAMRAIEGK